MLMIISIFILQLWFKYIFMHVFLNLKCWRYRSIVKFFFPVFTISMNMKNSQNPLETLLMSSNSFSWIHFILSSYSCSE